MSDPDNLIPAQVYNLKAGDQWPLPPSNPRQTPPRVMFDQRLLVYYVKGDPRPAGWIKIYKDQTLEMRLNEFYLGHEQTRDLMAHLADVWSVQTPS